MTNANNCDACQPAISPNAPVITNRPGLPAILYRVRSYATFRQAMISRIPFERIDITRPSGEPPLGYKPTYVKPLADWTVRQDDDFGIALIDMWAYIADVLTFYQERTANEAYLRTARWRDSLRRLATLLDYQPAPGVAATAYLAFTLQSPTSSSPETLIKPGLRAQSVPGQDEKPQKFETTESRIARYIWNRLTPVTTREQILVRGTPAIYLTGLIRTLKVGDALVIVGDERAADAGSERWDFRFVTQIDFLTDLTKVTLNEPLGAPRLNVSPAHTNPRVYVMRRRASLFGCNAPDWATLPEIVKRQALGHQFDVQTIMKTVTSGGVQTITTTTAIVAKAGQMLPALPADWNFAANPSGAQVIDLDAAYATILADHWIVLERPDYHELYRVDDVATQSRTDYMITGKITRMKVDTDENLPSFKTQTRSIVVYFGQEEVPFGAMPDVDPFPLDWIDVEGDHTALERERPLLLVGVAGGEDAHELAFINEARLQGNSTRLTFVAPLQHSYDRATLEIYANVVEATHGETVREVLGNGDSAQAFQTFALQKSPVTYVPQAGALNGAASTLEIRVNDLKWEAIRSFYGQDRGGAVYTALPDEAGKVTVRFGDGITGQRLPTGRGNVTAVYRQGIGAVGNLPAGTIKTLLDRPLGVKSVVNPLPSEGGAEAESAEAIRTNAPNTVRTFGRIVSLRDFEDAAREYAGVAKARAAIAWDNEDQYVHLTVACDRGADIEPGGSTYHGLLADLNTRRDPNRRLVLANYGTVAVTLKAKLIIDKPKFIAENVIEAVRAALRAYFAFDNLDLGRPVYLSDLYRVIHELPGVVAVDVDEFRKGPDSAIPRRVFRVRRPLADTLVQSAIPVESDQLIVLQTLSVEESQEPSL
jgi:hypothetical protein